MTDKLLQRLKRAVARKREKKRAETPCECGAFPLSPDDPMQRVAINLEGEPCPMCKEIAGERGLPLVGMMPPRGLDPDAEDL